MRDFARTGWRVDDFVRNLASVKTSSLKSRRHCRELKIESLNYFLVLVTAVLPAVPAWYALCGGAALSVMSGGV